MQRFTDQIHERSVPQTEPLPGQVQNNQSGYIYPVDDWKRLERFLVLGTEGGTYYVDERKLTVENAAAVLRCIQTDGPRAVRTILDVSVAGRAAKNDPALFALALAMKKGNEETRKLAAAMVPQVARIGTHLFHLAEYVKGLGGWGRGTMRAFGSWYTRQEPDHLALQLIKYQQRDGWSHRDVLRKAHPVAPAPVFDELFSYVTKGWDDIGPEPHPDPVLVKLWAFERAKRTTDTKELVRLITDYRLPRECVPTEALNQADVWGALLPHMGITAVVRNLGKMTSVGLLAPMSDATSTVIGKLEDAELLKKGRVHPLQLLVALKVYQQGRGDKGSLTWTPDRKVADALDGAFYTAFTAVEPTGKRHLLGIDVSTSMDGSKVQGMSISAREGAAAMALVTDRVEKQTHMMGFSHMPVRMQIGARTRLDQVISGMQSLPFGGTDCATPIVYALQQKIPVDVFVVYTDSETGVGNIHPAAALREYRERTGIAAKMVVVAMTSNGFTIADPGDAGAMDIVGFDTATPAVISDFVRS